MALAQCNPGDQLVVLHCVGTGNPDRGNAVEWTQPQLAARRCAEVTNKPCSRGLVGATLRSKLQPKALVTNRKATAKKLLWSPTPEVRAPRAA